MSNQSTYWPAARPAKPSQLPETDLEWMTTAATWPSDFASLLAECARVGLSGRMFPEYFQSNSGRRSEASSRVCGNAGIQHSGGFWMLNMSEWNRTLLPSRSEDGVFSLSDILETGGHLWQHCLSRKACAGIIRRAEKRGKKLPELLEADLRAIAEMETAPPKP